MKFKTLAVMFAVFAAVGFAAAIAGDGDTDDITVLMFDERGNVRDDTVLADMLNHRKMSETPAPEATEEQQMLVLLLLMLLQQGAIEIVIEPQPPPAIEDGPNRKEVIGI